MRNISRRVENVEKKLNLREEPKTTTIVLFGGGALPPDRTEGNRTLHFVKYEPVEI